MKVLILYGVLGFLFLITSIIKIKQEPRHISNGFLLELGIFYLLFFLVYLSFVLNDGFGLILGYAITFIVIICLIITGILLMVDGFYVIKKEGFSIVHIQPIFWGILTFLGAYAWYFNTFAGLSGSQIQVVILTFIMNLVLFIPLSIGGFFIYSFIYPKLKKPYPCDYIVVLGCGIRKDGSVTPLLKSRLDKALEWYHQTNYGKFIVSGGQGSDEVVSEAYAMKQYLIQNGVKETEIIVENKSTTTKENLLFSKKLMKEDSICVVSTSDFHVLRTAFLTKDLNLNAYCIGGKTAMYYVPPATLREYIALLLRHQQIVVFYLVLIIFITIMNLY